MSSIKTTARRAGVLYLVFALVAIVGEFLFPRFLVAGDPAATARNISDGELTYRVGIAIGLAVHVIFLFVVVSLHNLLRDVDRKQAMLMVMFVAVGVAVALGNLVNKAVPLVLLGGADYLSVFTGPQLDTLALNSLRTHGIGLNAVTTFWGLWLFPFGILVVKSRFIPKIFGVLLVIAGAAYVTTSVTTIVAPDFVPVISPFMYPLYFGEVPIIFWLLIRGARELQPAAPLPSGR